MATGDTAAPPPAEPSGVTPTEPNTGETRLSGSRVNRAVGGLGRGEWTKIIVVIGAGLVLAGTLLFAMPSLQVKASYYRCPLPLPTPTSSADVSSLSTSCRAPGAGGATTDQQALDAARSAARAPYGVLAAALLAGAAAVVGVIVNSHNARLTRDTINATLDANDETRRRDATTAELTRAGQYTDRYIKAIGLINDDKLNARVGGLYALEQLAREAPLTYHATIVDVLSAYIRERAPWPPPSLDALRPRSQRRVAAGRPAPASAPLDQPKKPALDVQTALTILGRRRPTYTTPDGQHHELEDHALDLSQTQLEGAVLYGAHLEGANLRRAHLEGANLNEAYLEDAILEGTYLEGAVLDGAYLERAFLLDAHLEHASLYGAHLERALLRDAHLERAVLDGAYLEGATLRGAHLEGAVLDGAHLERAILRGARLEGASLRGAHLEGALLTRARLEGADLDGAGLKGAFLSGAYLDDGALSRGQLATALLQHGPQPPNDQER